LKEDLGKSETEAWLLEISFVQVACRHARKHLRHWMRKRRVPIPVYALPGRSWIRPEPLGSVLIISPWNYPLQLCLAPLISAISAGNCAVLKPSEIAGATSAAIAKFVPQYMDQDCIKVIEGDREIAARLLEFAWDHIVFTGSEAVARVILTAAAKHLTPVTLELGGKSPCIVLPDADLDVAARRITWGKFTNAGQTCIAPDYILTDAKTASLLIEKIQKEVTKMFGDDPSESSDFGRIVNQFHFDRLQSLLGDSEIVIGGESRREERYLAPTVLHPVDVNSPLMQNEIFGPLLPIVEITGLDEAINFIRARAKPLAAYIFSSKDSSEQMVAGVSAGSICLNDVMIFMAIIGLPFGGVGASGTGHYNGKYGFDRLSHLKAVLRRSTWLDLQLRYAPSSKSKLKWLRWLR
jgi:aldehyde dehydrogenase (NAD+)